MNKTIAGRILLALLILVVDSLVVFIPLGALFIAYILIARPRAVKDWIDRLYD